MSDTKLLIAIVRRSHEPNYLDFFEEHEVPLTLSCPCEGTAHASLLEVLGLVQRQRTFYMLAVPDELAKTLLRRLVTRMHIDVPNEGVAMVVPAVRPHSIYDNEVKSMGEYPYSLIVAIAARGHSSAVMTAARAAGATGGTIVHAKGTGSQLTARFFGISIADEREMIYIAAPAEKRDDIMNAICDKAGKNTPAQAIVFALPVEAAAGLNFLPD